MSGAMKTAFSHGASSDKDAAGFHTFVMTRGWARFMYEDNEFIVEAGDAVHQRPGIVPCLFDYSSDMAYEEIVGPAEFGAADEGRAVKIPAPTPWT